MNERETIDRGWYYVVEPEQGRWASEPDRIVADDGRVLTRRLHAHPGRIEAYDPSGTLTVATLLRATGALARPLEDRGVRDYDALIELGPAGTAPAIDTAPDGRLRLRLDGPQIASAPSHHPVDAAVQRLLGDRVPTPVAVVPTAALPERPAPRAMFFESLMNTDMPHNDTELSQGVLHLVSPLRGTGTEVVLVNAKMPIVGDDRPVWGLEHLEEALAAGPIHLVGITLLEGYWEGVVHLIRTLRELGCRAPIAVGGVMPTLAPEHTAAHLPDVSFVCRGAGEYFVPRLARIVGTTTIDEPWSDAQRRALIELCGVIAIERADGLRVLCGQTSHSIKVDDLDRVELDLSHLQARHVVGGIEISTSRGCIHKCSFCSILGRESYQARSSGSIFEVLQTYEARFRELHGDRIPDNCFRVHISDDDFACDRGRARAFFERLLDSPFRLSSVQVAIGDLCRKVDGKLLVEPDHELLDAIKPECFADHGRPIPKRDFFEDHRSRTWSSFLQIGVETYDDREIARLGKGYKRAHVRAIVAELSRRRLHMDGYFILSNAETSLDDLVNVFTEVARLKLRFPEHFHMRFPVVPNLVSYFTSASHRRHVRRGRTHVMKLRGLAQVPSHPELDYPFVDRDEPEDVWVRQTVSNELVTDEGHYTGNLLRLRRLWQPWHAALPADDPDRRRLGRLVRVLDDRARRLVFEMLRQAWLGDDEGWPDARLDRQLALEVAERVLGDKTAWLDTFKASLKDADRRLVVAVTADDGGAAAEAIELLLATDAPRAVLHLIAPYEPVPGERLIAVIAAARARAAEVGVVLDVVVDADGWRWTPEVVAALVDVDVQVVVRPDDLSRVAALHALGIAPSVVLQVPVDRAASLDDDVRRLADLGVRQLALEPLPEGWTADAAGALGRALFAAATVLDALLVVDARRSGHFADLLVDRDGAIGRSDGLVPGVGLKASHRLGHLDDVTNVDRHALDRLDPASLPGVVRLTELERRTAAADKVIASFLSWQRRRAAPVAAHPR